MEPKPHTGFSSSPSSDYICLLNLQLYVYGFLFILEV